MTVTTEDRRRRATDPKPPTDGEIVTTTALAEMGVALRQLRRAIERAQRQNEQVRDRAD